MSIYGSLVVAQSHSMWQQVNDELTSNGLFRYLMWAEHQTEQSCFLAKKLPNNKFANSNMICRKVNQPQRFYKLKHCTLLLFKRNYYRLFFNIFQHSIPISLHKISKYRIYNKMRFGCLELTALLLIDLFYELKNNLERFRLIGGF